MDDCTRSVPSFRFSVTTSLASSTTKVSSPRPPTSVSAPSPPSSRSFPSSPLSRLAPAVPVIVSLPVPLRKFSKFVNTASVDRFRAMSPDSALASRVSLSAPPSTRESAAS